MRCLHDLSEDPMNHLDFVSDSIVIPEYNDPHTKQYRSVRDPGDRNAPRSSRTCEEYTRLVKGANTSGT
jgi:hypothetical protein